MHLWHQFLEKLEEDFGKPTVDKWLRSLTILRFDACNLYLEAQDTFQTLWFKEHIRHKAQKMFLNHAMRPIKIHLSIAKSASRTSPPSTQTTPLFTFSSDPISPLFTYDNFIETKENNLPLRIFSKLCHEPSLLLGQYNPIFLYGDKGSGKTHLLSALTLALQGLKQNVLYVKAETFTENMIQAMRHGHMADFRKIYRSADILIIDNIDHLSNKFATQEEFFHTFNAYHTCGKQLILASSISPKKLERIENRLISRFEWGITLTLTKLQQDSMPLLLLKKIKLLNLSLARDLSNYLLSSFHEPHGLCHALDVISYHHHLHPEIHSFKIDDVKALLHPLIHQYGHNTLSSDKILHSVAEVFDKTTEELKGKGQTKDIVFPRQIAMYLLREKLKMPYLKIGHLFNKDHSTVMSGTKQCNKAIQSKDPQLLNILSKIEKKLSNNLIP